MDRIPSNKEMNRWFQEPFAVSTSGQSNLKRTITHPKQPVLRLPVIIPDGHILNIESWDYNPEKRT